MPAESTTELSSQAQAILRRLHDKAGVIQLICQRMDFQNQITIGFIQSQNLSGPGKKDRTTLAVVTGLLRRSVHATPARAEGGMIAAGIGSNVKYAAPHEFGFDGDVQVPEHTRRNAIVDRFDYNGVAVNRTVALRAGILSKRQASAEVQASGKYVFAKKRAKQTVAGGSITVKAHTMHMAMPARHVFARGIAARMAEIGIDISDSIVKFFGGAQ